jgi:hypothetical protein
VRWFLVWLVLVLAAAGVFFLVGRDLWRKARALTRELGEATDRLTEITDRLSSLEPHPPASSDVRSQGSFPRQQR